MASEPRIVEVEWEDSNGIGGWVGLSGARSLKPYQARSVGYVVEESKGHLTICQAIPSGPHEDDQKTHEYISAIPRSAIRKVRTLHRGRS